MSNVGRGAETPRRSLNIISSHATDFAEWKEKSTFALDFLFSLFLTRGFCRISRSNLVSSSVARKKKKEVGKVVSSISNRRFWSWLPEKKPLPIQALKQQLHCICTARVIRPAVITEQLVRIYRCSSWCFVQTARVPGGAHVRLRGCSRARVTLQSGHAPHFRTTPTLSGWCWRTTLPTSWPGWPRGWRTSRPHVECQELLVASHTLQTRM